MLEFLKPIYTNIWYVLLIGLFFGGSIFVHELGHFLAARRRGLKIDRFSIGFGPKIFSWTRHGVEYRLSWIPLGGYVALPQLADMRGVEGEPATDTTQLPPISYTDKMIVSVMGAVFNLLFAFLLACLLWVIKQPERADQTTTKIGYISSTISVEGPNGSTRLVPSPAAEAGLQVGDRVVSIDGKPLEDWEDLQYAIVTGVKGATDGRRRAEFVVERNGELHSITVYPQLAGDEQNRTAGIAADYDVIVAGVATGTLAHEVGLRTGDVLVSADDLPLRNIATYLDALQHARTAALKLVVRRGAETLTLTVPPRPGPVVSQVVPGSIAEQAGLRKDDVLLSLDGQPVTSSDWFVRRLLGRPDAEMTLGIQRGTETLTLQLPSRSETKGMIGINLPNTIGEDLTIPATLVRVNPVRQFSNIVEKTFMTLRSLVDPRSDIGLSKMSGPVGIMNVYYQAVRAEFRFVLWLTVVVNINLAIFNLLPIPVLDGGHMLFATIAKLRGRAISPHFLMTTQSVFMVLLLTMVVYVSFFDVRRIGSLFRGDPPVAVEETPDASGPAPDASTPVPAPATP